VAAAAAAGLVAGLAPHPAQAGFAASLIDAPRPGLSLVQDGRTEYVVVVASNAIPSERYAAAELAKYVEQMTGARLAVVKDDTPPQAREIVLGAANARLSWLGIRPPADRWGYDGFWVKTAGRRLILAGDPPRGTLYAVYEFLEAQGVRFFAPDVTRIPRQASLTCGAVDRVHTPAFEGRGQMLYTVQQSDNDWAVRLRYNSPWFGQWTTERGGNIRYGFGPHSFFSIIPPEKYFKEHPEWFSEIQGQRLPQQLCLTNPDLLAESVRVLLERMRAAPAVRHWDVSQVDNLGFCQCRNCAAVATAEGSQAGPIIRFVNAVAAQIEREFPRNVISTFAYHYGENPPRTLQARANVAVRICTDKDILRPLASDSPIARQRAMAARLEGWRAHASNLFIWDYDTNFADYLDIFPSYAMYRQHLQFYRDNRVTMVDVQGAYSTPWGDLCYLRGYLLGKLLWNPDGDDRALIREYVDEVYAPHGQAVQDYLDACVALALKANPDQPVPAGGYTYNKGGYRYADLQPWRDRFEQCLASETNLIRQKHWKLLLLPIYKIMVEADRPSLVQAAKGLKPDREISDDYRRTVDRLFALGRDFQIAAYREGGGDLATFEHEVRSVMQPQPYTFLRSTAASARLLPGRGGGIDLVQIPLDAGPTRLRAAEVYVGWKWRDPGWCENYQIEESASTRLRMKAALSGLLELERTVEWVAPTTLRLTEKLTNRGPEQIAKPFYSNYIFPMQSREADTVYFRRPDGMWQAGRHPKGGYEQMQGQGYGAGGGWALVNRKTGAGVAVRFEPKDAATIGFWVDNNFSFQLTTPAFRLNKDESAARSHDIEFLSPEQSKAITGPAAP